MRLVLASTSPRRHELLTLLGLPFEVVAPPFVEEVMPHLPADRQAAAFASGKAQSCAAHYPDGLVIGSDTLISLGSEVLGKPFNLADAESMLRRMAGQTHKIYTAVALVRHDDGLCDVQVATVHVTMKAFGKEALAAYLRTGESLGKAGAYSIQGAGGALIEQIEGDYTAAVGLPLRMVAGMLHRREMICPVDVDQLYALRPYPNWTRFGS
jgi:septum formation protein